MRGSTLGHERSESTSLLRQDSKVSLHQAREDSRKERSKNFTNDTLLKIHQKLTESQLRQEEETRKFDILISNVKARHESTKAIGNSLDIGVEVISG